MTNWHFFQIWLLSSHSVTLNFSSSPISVWGSSVCRICAGEMEGRWGGIFHIGSSYAVRLRPQVVQKNRRQGPAPAWRTTKCSSTWFTGRNFSVRDAYSPRSPVVRYILWRALPFDGASAWCNLWYHNHMGRLYQGCFWDPTLAASRNCVLGWVSWCNERHISTTNSARPWLRCRYSYHWPELRAWISW